MNRRSVSMVAIATVLAAATASAQTRPTAQDQTEMQRAQFLVGKWNCTHAVGDFSGTYTTTFTSALGSTWLEQVQDFPAAGGDAPVHTEYFFGYDGRGPQWVRFGAHSNAQYYGMIGKRAENVWSWSYVLPGRTGSAVWTKQSDREYTIDGPTYPQNGKMVTEHHDCRKVA